MKLLNTFALASSLLAFNAYSADLVIMTGSIHSKDNESYNNANYGLGLESKLHSFTVGAYLFNNSYEKPSLMLDVSKHIALGEQFSVGAGIAMATGYEEDVNSINGIMTAPNVTIRYGRFRMKTTAGIGSLMGSVDVINFQYIVEL